MLVSHMAGIGVRMHLGLSHLSVQLLEFLPVVAPLLQLLFAVEEDKACIKYK